METERKYYRRRRNQKRRRYAGYFLTGAVLAVLLGVSAGGLSGRKGEAPDSTGQFLQESLEASVSGTENGEEQNIVLPERFDLRESVSICRVPDQGNFATCWAFASLTALETTMPPRLRTGLSADHMSLRNSSGLGQDEGGDFSMSMAYLLAWQGPVAEEEDPYGDGVSPEGLTLVCHVQEIRILPEKDRDRIRQAVYTCGGVQSALYFPMEDPEEREKYYREDTYALYYDGMEAPNHDVVILGWDDAYPRENFRNMPEEDGAFLCMNSWGSGFGENGCFWVSYEDTRLGIHNILYSGVEPADNYSGIYQTDLCGWTGQLGYGDSRAWFSNVYKAQGDEMLAAAGLYATVPGTWCRIYTAADIPETGQSDIRAALEKRTLAASVTFDEAGFYTVPFDDAVPVSSGERFAVIAEIGSPGTKQPVAVEYRADTGRENIDITDGEGYISPDGRLWSRAEEKEGCNLCLKVYSVKEEND